MPDSHWVRYKQIRGQGLPESARLWGTEYRLAQTLKRDFYAVTGLYARDDLQAVGPKEVLLKIYHTDPLGPFDLAGMGRWLCRRESFFLKRLADIPGVPRWFADYGTSG